MFQNIGWMDDAGAMIMDTVNADIATLPSELQTTLRAPSDVFCVRVHQRRECSVCRPQSYGSVFFVPAHRGAVLAEDHGTICGDGHDLAMTGWPI